MLKVLIKKQKMHIELQKINVLRGVLMQKGNKERINSYILKLHKALKTSQNRIVNKKPLQIINDAIEKSSPIFTFRRVVKAGRLYEIPVPISLNRATFMSTTWLSKVSKKRSQEGSPMYKFLAPELLNIIKRKGAVMEQLHTYTADGLEKNIFKKMIRKKRSVISRSKGINAYKDILSRINQTVRSRKIHGKTRQIAFSLRRLKKRHSGRNKVSQKKSAKKRTYIYKKRLNNK